MHEETLAKPTGKLFDKFAKYPWLSSFYLAGGTALALRLGHRISVDLDFFTDREFVESQLVDRLTSIGLLEIFRKERQSVIGSLDGVKFSFLAYPYPAIVEPSSFQGIRIASLQDIASMKLDALASRGTKRDFVDLYCIAKEIPLKRLLELFTEKYSSVKYNSVHIKKSLVYFDDAESDPLPDMLVPLTWDGVKDFFRKEALVL